MLHKLWENFLHSGSGLSSARYFFDSEVSQSSYDCFEYFGGLFIYFECDQNLARIASTSLPKKSSL